MVRSLSVARAKKRGSGAAPPDPPMPPDARALTRARTDRSSHADGRKANAGQAGAAELTDPDFAPLEPNETLGTVARPGTLAPPTVGGDAERTRPPETSRASDAVQVARQVAALFVRPDGPYPGLVADWWDAGRDARKYAGPFSVVAHPPCSRWGRYWWADGSDAPGNDGGLFAAALASVRRWGGVLEHPEGSHAWRMFDLPPAASGAWCRTITDPGWATCVPQSNYGHRAQKLTWLYYVGRGAPPPLDWSRSAHRVYLSQPGRCSRARPRVKCSCRRCRNLFGARWQGSNRVEVERMSARERELTPVPFARLLIEIARGA